LQRVCRQARGAAAHPNRSGNQTALGEIPCEIETFIFGNHGLMLEGRCSLTNYATGLSTNMDGVCSPAAQVRFEESDDGVVISRLGAEVIDCFKADESAGYPTICKGRYTTGCRSQPYYAFEEPVTLNLAPALSELIGAGVQAFKIEGRQRSRAYVRAVVSAFRQAIDAVQTGREPDVDHLIALAEGQKQTEGASKTKKWR
jgi:putative protease